MKLSLKKDSFRISLGERGEMIACGFLHREGYRILEKNYRCPLGEIDVIAAKAGRTHFIEVKTRTSHYFGDPAEAVHKKKQQKLAKLAQWYLKSKQMEDSGVSFSVVAVRWNAGAEPQIKFIQDAFEADNF